MTIWPWPSSVPFICSLDDLQYSGPKNDVAVFEPDVGPPMLRRRTTAAYRTLYGATPVLSADEFAAFEAFWNDDLEGGVGRFTATHPVTGKAATFQPDGRGYDVIPLGRGQVRVRLGLYEVPE